jgi:hypothetical protein
MLQPLMAMGSWVLKTFCMNTLSEEPNCWPTPINCALLRNRSSRQEYTPRIYIMIFFLERSSMLLACINRLLAESNGKQDT